jgi:hypothetical protein
MGGAIRSLGQLDHTRRSEVDLARAFVFEAFFLRVAAARTAPRFLAVSFHDP